jgi:hypothetical protein
MSIARVFAVCVCAASVFGLWTQSRAGTLPDISGTWYANGSFTKRCHITQSGRSVSLSNEVGATATGSFTDPSTLSTNWGPFGGGRVTGSISSDLRRITWSNGTFWSRPAVAPIVPAPPTPAPATATPKPTPSPVPLRVSVHVPNNDSNPVYVYAASLTNGWQPFTYAQCVSFRNVTAKVATAVDFSFVVTNDNGGVEADFGWADKGTFTPPVNIDDHCFRGGLWAPRVVRAMTHESIRVTQVIFADGTFWKTGMQFSRVYSTSGERLATPQLQPALQTAQSGESTGETVPAASNDLFAPSPYRLRSALTGSGACLDVINNGQNDQLTMAACGNYSGQMWHAAKAGQGQARLSNRFTGPEMCLDVVNDGRNNRLRMAPCGDYSGQFWWTENAGQGYVRLKNAFTGSGKCLGIVNDARNNQLAMARCANYPRQRWIVGP